jgi:hypothetical protein
MTAANITFKSQASKPDAKSTFTVGTNPFCDRSSDAGNEQVDEYFAAEAEDGRLFARNRWPDKPLGVAPVCYVNMLVICFNGVTSMHVVVIFSNVLPYTT